MKTSIYRSFRGQYQSLFSGISNGGGKKKTAAFHLILALPFFAVPALIAGMVAAGLGQAYSTKAVTFIRSRESKPVTPVPVFVSKGPTSKRRVATGAGAQKKIVTP